VCALLETSLAAKTVKLSPSPSTPRGKKPVGFPKREKENKVKRKKLKLLFICLKAQAEEESRVLCRSLMGPWGKKPKGRE
jgi:hypothetical protein